MPDLSGWPIVDVAIGLSFLFFLLSVAASAIYELAASWLALRAKNLEHAIRSLLAGEVDVYANWRIRALFKDPDDEDNPRKPSYIPPRTFALALFDTLAPPDRSADADPDANVLEAARATVKDIKNDRVREQLSAILDVAEQDIEAGRREVEQLFDDRMQRASGWYKRRAQLVLAIIAAAMAFGFNVNVFHVGSDLWKNDALRAAVVTQAQSALEKPATAGGQARNCPAGQVPDQETPEAGDCKPNPDALAAVAKSVDDIQELDLPIGWGDRNMPSGLGSWLGWFFGCLISAAAISLGAPFWFSTLQRFADIRGAGGKPGEDDEDEGDEPARGSGDRSQSGPAPAGGAAGGAAAD